MADDGAPRFLTVAEVAEMARVSRMTVYRMVHSGELPAIRVGKSYRVPQAAAEEMLSGSLGEWNDPRTASGH
ncbi:helix-turn-helix domain-containing protein [Ruania suaedae]|uniref:helix-turn-helix domain-containing protein n=1 Tax=Ruania suaedae TaxID=2897774 RepID=UPI001E34029C|nr:helix-turn-helix domain-containing protein [Ruania suaedae]UFU02508.1 helix-turn-helix domain-containing protein [Ruania suaedae]